MPIAKLQLKRKTALPNQLLMEQRRGCRYGIWAWKSMLCWS